MKLKEISKNSLLVKMYGEESDGVYIVEDTYDDDGSRTIIVTSDPLKAKTYNLIEALKEVYTSLSADEKRNIMDNYKKEPDQRSGYYSFTRALGARFKVVTTRSVDSYVYAEDLQYEQQLLKDLDLEYIYNDLNSIIKIKKLEDGEDNE